MPSPQTSFFTHTATPEIYTLSLHDALPILRLILSRRRRPPRQRPALRRRRPLPPLPLTRRSEEHTSELQSQSNLVCRLLLEKKKRDCSAPSRGAQRRGAGPILCERAASRCQ